MANPLTELLKRIDELKSAIDALRPIPADRMGRIMQHLRLEWNFNSNSMRFIRIHPFGDGNGRMARICTNLVLMLSGYMPLILRQEDKQEYYRALNQSSTDDVTSLALFFGAALIRSLELTLRGARGESIEDSEEWKQKAKEMSNPISLEEK